MKEGKDHEVNSSNITQLHFKNALLRHFMPLGNIPSPLAPIACHNKAPCIFEHVGPIKTRLEGLSNGLLCSKVSTISRSTAMV